ncbi:phosphopantothenoylcysteine decarboxylase / phosphopantothenate--cysteine ligase [Alteromonadaceae bacterium Bs31]|nr:phosphopantothenoylcysteine decarboxylase / phosphopantothenate--cysteine ligase [Alteromonadaceae bacterium Bs31]
MDKSSLSSLCNKNVLLGISGGIAAYKCAELVRLFIGQGANVRVVMTSAAKEFVTPLTLQALSGNPVHTSILDADEEAGMGHIELARWADILLIAPATADVISRLAQGQASDLLSTLVLAITAPVVIAPAMNQAMWRDAATQQNVEQLRSRSFQIAGPAEGEQACGDVGPGRMLEIDALTQIIANKFESGLLAGRKVLITAGPTYEPIDPVRYIGNRSSGKMAYALAQAAVEASASVSLVSGPTALPVPDKLSFTRVETAQQMLDASLREAQQADIVIAAAAVADYRPAETLQQKMKKGDERLFIELVKNPDIVAAVAALPGERYVCGFAAETQNVEAYAVQKMQQKGLQAIIANNVANPGIGFNSDENAVQAFSCSGEQKQFSQRSKAQLARDLIAWIALQMG